MKYFSDKKTLCLICVNASLYVLIVAIDIKKAAYGITYEVGIFCDICKYAAIISCLLICLFSFAHTRKRSARLQIIVFFITLAADFFLLFTPFFVVGVFIFLGAHLCALTRYRPRWTLPAGLCAVALLGSTMYFATQRLHIDTASALLIAVCTAYGMLIISVTVSTFLVRSQPNAPLPRIGMLMFIACDINVAIFNMPQENNAIYMASTVLMWLFYLPAQTLLALSVTDLPHTQKK